MTISMEKIDELRKRTNCSYEEAKSLLEKHDGNVLDAIVDFEKTQGCKFGNCERHTLGQKMKSLFRKGFNTRFVVESNKDIIINISINFLILLSLISIHVVIVGSILALISGYKFRIIKQSGKDINVDEFINNVTDKVKKSVNDITQDEKTQKNEKDKTGYNEITIE